MLLPVAFTIGDDFSPVERRPAREITWFDKWGRTLQNPTDGRPPVHADGAGITVEVDVDAKPADLWPYVSDIDLPARFSDEFQGAEWLDDEPAVGARFLGRNKRDDMGEWEVTCTVVDFEHERVFAWHAGDPDNPAAQWRFEIQRCWVAPAYGSRWCSGPERPASPLRSTPCPTRRRRSSPTARRARSPTCAAPPKASATSQRPLVPDRPTTRRNLHP